jgi:hypothetical protein
MEARRLGAPAAKLFESLGECHIPPVRNSGDDIHVRTSAINVRTIDQGGTAKYRDAA